jgi:hypothetical protein
LLRVAVVLETANLKTLVELEELAVFLQAQLALAQAMSQSLLGRVAAVLTALIQYLLALQPPQAGVKAETLELLGMQLMVQAEVRAVEVVAQTPEELREAQGLQVRAILVQETILVMVIPEQVVELERLHRLEMVVTE